MGIPASKQSNNDRHAHTRVCTRISPRGSDNIVVVITDIYSCTKPWIGSSLKSHIKERGRGINIYIYIYIYIYIGEMAGGGVLNLANI